VTVNLQLLNQNNAKQQVCKAKAQKGVDWALELKSQKQQKMLRTAPVGLQEGAGGQSSNVLCIPKGMHSCPRVRDNYTAIYTNVIFY